MKILFHTLLLLLIVSFALNAPTRSASADVAGGPTWKASISSCQASGPNDRVLIYSPGASQTCAQACKTIPGSAVASCVEGWTVWKTQSYQYGNECLKQDSSGGQGTLGKLCCCTGTKTAQPSSFGTPFAY